MLNVVAPLVKPLEGGPARKLAASQQKPPENTATVLYVGRIPHGFYEKEMEGAFLAFVVVVVVQILLHDFCGLFLCLSLLFFFLGYFGQFGTIKRLRIARNKKVCCMLVYLFPLLVFVVVYIN